jgi:hypothetical protein
VVKITFTSGSNRACSQPSAPSLTELTNSIFSLHSFGRAWEPTGGCKRPPRRFPQPPKTPPRYLREESADCPIASLPRAFIHSPAPGAGIWDTRPMCPPSGMRHVGHLASHGILRIPEYCLNASSNPPVVPYRPRCERLMARWRRPGWCNVQRRGRKRAMARSQHAMLRNFTMISLRHAMTCSQVAGDALCPSQRVDGLAGGRLDFRGSPRVA